VFFNVFPNSVLVFHPETVSHIALFPHGPSEVTFVHTMLAPRAPETGFEGPPGAQRALKRALLAAYHGEGRNISAPDVLVELAAGAGLPAERAREVLDRGEFADEVRQAERFWQEVGIHSVPAVIVDRKHLISGGQPSAVFEQALRQIAAESAPG
jgi:predicted DsbA family dithiol-disulfide isomerase